MSFTILFNWEHRRLILVLIVCYLLIGTLFQQNGSISRAESIYFPSKNAAFAQTENTTKTISDRQSNPDYDSNVPLDGRDIYLESMEDLHHVTYLSMLNYNITDKGLLESSALITIGNAVGAHKQHQKTLPPATIESETDNKIRLALMLESFILHLRNGHLERVPLDELRAIVENLNITQIYERLRQSQSADQHRIRSNATISDRLILGRDRNNSETKQFSLDRQQFKPSQSTTVERCNYLLALYKYELSQSQNYNLMDPQQHNEAPDIHKRSFGANSNEFNSSIEREQRVPPQSFDMKNVSMDELDMSYEFNDNRMMGLCRLVVDCLSANELVKAISGPWRDNDQEEDSQPQQQELPYESSTNQPGERNQSAETAGKTNFKNLDSPLATSATSNKQQSVRTLRESLSKSIAKLCPLILFQLHDNEETCTFRREDRPSMLTVWGFATLFVTIVSFCSLIGLSITPFIGGNRSNGSSINDLATESSDESGSMMMKGHSQQPGQRRPSVSPVTYHQAQYHKASLTLFEGLAVGSLVGSALFSLIPQAFELQERESNHRFLLKAFIIFSGIYLFFCSERIMRIILDTRHKQKRQMRLNHRSSNSIQPIASGSTATALVAANSNSNNNNNVNIINSSNNIGGNNIIGQNVSHQHRSQPWYRYYLSQGTKSNIATNYPSSTTMMTTTTPTAIVNVHKTFSRTVNKPSEGDGVSVQEYSNVNDSRVVAEGQFEEKNRTHKLSTTSSNNAQLPLSDKTRRLLMTDSDQRQHRQSHNNNDQQQSTRTTTATTARRRRKRRRLHRQREARKAAAAAKASINIGTNYGVNHHQLASGRPNNAIVDSVGQSEISIKKSSTGPRVRVDRDQQLSSSSKLVVGRKTRDQALARQQRDRNKLLRQQSLRRAIQDDDYYEQSDNDEEYYQLKSLDLSLSEDISLTDSSSSASCSLSSPSTCSSSSSSSSSRSASRRPSSRTSQLSLSSASQLPSATSFSKKRSSHRKRLRKQQRKAAAAAFRPQQQQQQQLIEQQQQVAAVAANCSESAAGDESDARLTSSNGFNQRQYAQSSGFGANNNKDGADGATFIASPSHIDSDNPLELKAAVSRQISEIVQLNQVYKSSKRSRYDRVAPHYVSSRHAANVPAPDAALAAAAAAAAEAAIYQPSVSPPGTRLTFGQPVSVGGGGGGGAGGSYPQAHLYYAPHCARDADYEDGRAKQFINSAGGANGNGIASGGGYIPRDISTVAWMIVLGDGLHNFIDGISIGAAFSESILSGVSISVAVICEEFPHELGDFAVLVSSGMTVRQALGYNFLSACTCYFGMAIGIVLGDVNDAASYISALAAGVFLYIALVDMMGELSATLEETSRDSMARTLKLLLLQNVGIFVGISIIFVLSFIDF